MTSLSVKKSLIWERERTHPTLPFPINFYIFLMLSSNPLCTENKTKPVFHYGWNSSSIHRTISTLNSCMKQQSQQVRLRKDKHPGFNSHISENLYNVKLSNWYRNKGPWKRKSGLVSWFQMQTDLQRAAVKPEKLKEKF